MLITFVFATATSRLHADIIVIRLKRAGVPVDLISALYLPHLRPNCVDSWLGGGATRSLSSGGAISISGLLRFTLGEHHVRTETLARRLNRLGLVPAQSVAIEQSLLKSHVVLCVQADNPQDLSAVFRSLRSTRAEDVLVAETETTRGVIASQWAAPYFPLRTNGQPALALCPAI
jgi:hypothetical protein